MPRTKEAPASQSLAARATKGPNGTSKGSVPSVAPSLEDPVAVRLVTIDADAGASPQARAAGAALRELHGRDTVRPVILARHALAEELEATLGPNGETFAPILADVAVLHVVRGLTPEAVLVLARSHPELVVEMKRLVEENEKTREAGR